MDHRAKKHPSNKICKNIPECSGWVKDKKCWYVHPELKDQPTDTTPIIQEDKDIKCRRCMNNYGSRNEFMTRLTTEDTSLIVCRDWVKNKCRRERCWYRHSHSKPNQVISTVQFVQKKNRIFHQFSLHLSPQHRPGLKWQHRIYLNSQPRTSHWSKR